MVVLIAIWMYYNNNPNSITMAQLMLDYEIMDQYKEFSLTNIILEQLQLNDNSIKNIVKKNTIFKYDTFLVLDAMYILQ